MQYSSHMPEHVCVWGGGGGEGGKITDTRREAGKHISREEEIRANNIDRWGV